MTREIDAIDALVATKIFSFTVKDHRVFTPIAEHAMGGKWNVLPRYTTDPSADYQVLKFVRENWSMDQQDKFDDAYEDIMISRAGKSQWHSLLYEPGDWSRSALKALGEEV